MNEISYKGETAARYPEVQDWCEANCGEFGVDWSRLGRDPMSDVIANETGVPVKDTYYFATEKMLTMFLLKWG